MSAYLDSWRPGPLPYSRFDIVATACILATAFLTRLLFLGSITDKNTPVFDEKHYVPQAFDMVGSFIDPITGGIESNPGFGLVVHPPLGKQLIVLSEFIFGYSPWGWRLSGAIAGVLVVALIMATTRLVSKSSLAGLAAGILATCDGVLITGSRFGMLDIFIVLFITAAAYCLARDRRDVDTLLAKATRDGVVALTQPLGPRMGFRWWRFACGVCLGLAVSVKWSGLYYMACFGIAIVVGDWLSRRRYGVAKPMLGALVKDSIIAFADLVIIPVALYLWSFRAWFASETSVYRHSISSGKIPAHSFLTHFGEALGSFIDYHIGVLKFHESITSSSGHHHPWDSKPFSWLAATRPVLYYSQDHLVCVGGKTNCRAMVYLFGIPAIWWIIVPLVLWSLWCLVVSHDRRFCLPLVGFAAGFVFWVAAYDRQMYFFYAEPLVPFVAILFGIVIWQLVRPRRRSFAHGRAVARAIAVGYLALIVANFAYFSPIIYGIPITNDTYNSMMWMTSWR